METKFCDLLDTTQAATLLGIKPNTLEIWRTQGRSPKFLKIGRNVRYRLSDIEAFLDGSYRATTRDSVAAKSNQNEE